MRFFQRNKARPPAYPCPRCGSTNTGLIISHGSDQPDYVRVWQGHRFLTFRCFKCGHDFYVEEPAKELLDRIVAEAEARTVDDADALHAAEEEIARQSEEDDDRLCR